MELTKKQAETIRNKSRFKVLNWGRRSGKTTVFAYEALGTALTKDKAQITYYAQTFGDARDIAWNIFLEVFGDAVKSKNETLLEITVMNLKGGESYISLKGWESVYQSGKGRGTQNDLILADEVAFCRQFIQYWETVLAPTLLTTKGRAVFGSTPNGFNNFYDLSNKARNTKDWWYSHATSYDNPFNDPQEIERIKNEIPEDRFYQEYMADFRKMEGLVYKEFDRTKHLFDTDVRLIRGIYKWVSIDWGFTNPSAIYTISEDGDKNFFIHSEYYERGKTTDELVDVASARLGNGYYPDPAEPDRIEMLRRKGLTIKEVSKDVVAGIDTLKSLFKNGKIKIHKDCVNLINELETYAYKEKKDGANEQEEPIKENDHALDSIRYCLHMRANQKLKNTITVNIPNYGNSNYTSSEQQYKHNTKQRRESFSSPFLRS